MVTLERVQKFAIETKSCICTFHLYAKQDKQRIFSPNFEMCRSLYKIQND
jgi:hypothetical protein